MNKYDKEDTAGGCQFALAMLLSFIVGLFALIGFIFIVTFLLELID